MRLKVELLILAGLLFPTVGNAQETAPAAAAAPAAPAVDPRNILDLDLSTGGRVQILLRPDKAPLAVDRIRALAQRGFYNGLTFHRVIDGFMAQGGDPKGTGEGGSDLPDLKAEFNDLPHVRGAVAMARTETPDSANSQFYIMLSPNLKLDRRYTVIGRVISGMQYVDMLEKGESPANPSKIVKAAMEAEGAPSVAAAPAAATPATSAEQAAADAAARKDMQDKVDQLILERSLEKKPK